MPFKDFPRMLSLENNSWRRFLDRLDKGIIALKGRFERVAASNVY